MIYLFSNNFSRSCSSLSDIHLNETIIDTAMSVSHYLWHFHSDTVAFDAAHFYSNDRISRGVKSDIHRALFAERNPQKDLYDWVIKSESNYAYLIQYLIVLSAEYEYRFSKRHKLSHIIPSLPKRKFESVKDAAHLERKMHTCIELYKTSGSRWKWTNRDQPQYVI